MEIDVGQTKLFGKKSSCFNLNPVKPNQTFFLIMNVMDGAEKVFVLYF